MVRGMSMATRLITLLVDKIKDRDGHEEMLHFLTTELGRENLDKIVELIVSLKWTVPKSIVMKLAREISLKEYPEGDHADSDELFYWQPALQKLGIPLISFNFEGKDVGDDTRWPIPPELLEQLWQDNAKPAMIVDWEGEKYVIVGLAFQHEKDVEVGDPIEMYEIHFLHLSPAHYFDLEN